MVFSSDARFIHAIMTTRPLFCSCTIAGINLKANNWRKAIEWYNKEADAETDPGQKVAALNSIGNVAWSKLNSKTLEIKDTGGYIFRDGTWDV